mgnify:CR=1 FL=1
MREAWARAAAALRALVPRPIADVWARDPKELAIRLDTQTGAPHAVIRGERRLVDATFLRAARQRWGGLISATLEVPQSACLVRDLKLPRATVHRADEILALDLARTTPFWPGDVYTGWYCPAGQAPGDQAGVRQVIVKRAMLADPVRDFAEAGLPLKSIAVVDEAGGRLPVELVPPGEHLRAPVTRLLGRAVIALAALAALLAAGSLALRLVSAQRSLTATEAALEAATREARSIRQRIGNAEASASDARQPRLRRIATPPVVAVWEEITRTLPATTYLTDLRIDDGAVQIDGYAANASELIGVLAKSAMFTGIAFASPVTRDIQRGAERFQIRLRTNPATTPEKRN